MNWTTRFLSVLGLGSALAMGACTVPLEPQNSASTEADVSVTQEVGTVPEPKEIAPAVEIEQGGEQITLWLVDEETGDRVQQLMKESAQEISADFSNDKKWLVVSERAFSDLQTLHLFKRSAPNAYTKIEREKFTGGLWDEFIAELQHSGVILKYVTSFKGWQEEEDSVALQLGVLPRDGTWIQKDYVVDLAQF